MTFQPNTLILFHSHTVLSRTSYQEMGGGVSKNRKGESHTDIPVTYLLTYLLTWMLLCISSPPEIWPLPFLSRVSTLTRDIDIAILSVRPSVCPSVCLTVHYIPVSDENGLT